MGLVLMVGAMLVLGRRFPCRCTAHTSSSEETGFVTFNDLHLNLNYFAAQLLAIVYVELCRKVVDWNLSCTRHHKSGMLLLK